MSLGKFLAAWQGNVAKAEGRAAERPTLLQRLARLRRRRDLHVGVARHGGRGTSFDRGTFLLAKQLLYFERYGKMFLGDTSLLEDRPFFERVFGAGPLHEPTTTDAAPVPSRAAR